MTSSNLYAAPLDGAQFTALCGGNAGGDNETCIEMARIPGTDGFALRDNKAEADGSVLRVSRSELLAFLDGAPAIVSA